MKKSGTTRTNVPCSSQVNPLLGQCNVHICLRNFHRIFYRHKWNCWKVMFSHVFVCSQGGIFLPTMPWGRQTPSQQKADLSSLKADPHSPSPTQKADPPPSWYGQPAGGTFTEFLKTVSLQFGFFCSKTVRSNRINELVSLTVSDPALSTLDSISPLQSLGYWKKT